VLVLTRKVDEAVNIGDHIKVKVIQIHGKQVRLGIEAPPGILIIREVYVEAKGSLTLPETNSCSRSSRFPKPPQP
jgi:carbon storage regulator